MTISEDLLQRVWEKAMITDLNPKIWRKDHYGAWISRIRHGDRNSDYGWEIEHVNPDEGDDVSNLRPLQWKNNIDKTKPKPPVTSAGYNNSERKFSN